MSRHASLVAAFLVCAFLRAEGAPPPPRTLRYPLWTCSDGKGAVSLFWLPVAGDWPAGGYRLERVARGRTTVLGGPFRPGQDARAMMEIDPADADAIRSLADKIERGTLTDEERNRSVSGLGRAAAADPLLGRALGVRHTDVPGTRGKVVYRLTALGADGGAGSTMESAEVDPARTTPAPGRPAGLRAEERDDGVALFWTDPPAGPVAPVVGYRVDRSDGGRRQAALTPKPLLLERHLRRGEPEFLDGSAPAKRLTYQVRSVDIFGRLSAAARTGIAPARAAAANGPPGPKTADSRPATPPATAVASARSEAPPETPAAAPLAPGPAVAVEAAPASAAAAAPAPPAAPAPAPPTRDETARSAPERTEAPASPAQAAAGPPEPRPVPQIRGNVVWTEARPEPPADPDPTAAAQQSGPPPQPVITGISGMGDRVVVRFKPGEPEGLTRTFLALRSESPTGTGVTVGRPIPGNARQWEDTSVSAGQFFWYRLVAVDGAGNRSEPSKPKWVSTGSR